MRDGRNMKLLTPMNEELRDLKVCDLFIPNSLEWDVEMLEELFVERDVKEIMNLLPKIDDKVDKRIWKWDRSGEYYVKSVYRFTTERLETNVDLFVAGYWSKLWSIHVPLKVRQFAWRLAPE